MPFLEDISDKLGDISLKIADKITNLRPGAKEEKELEKLFKDAGTRKAFESLDLSDEEMEELVKSIDDIMGMDDAEFFLASKHIAKLYNKITKQNISDIQNTEVALKELKKLFKSADSRSLEVLKVTPTGFEIKMDPTEAVKFLVADVGLKKTAFDIIEGKR